MISAGNNITAAMDTLHEVSVNDLYNNIVNPSDNIRGLVRNLRIVREIDTKKYTQAKKQLPYFVCAHFSPSFRKTENFTYTEYFFVDVDHISDKELDIEEVRKRVVNDERVMMCFASPSGDGLKLLFRLKEKCYDTGIYSVFYKTFIHHFAIRHNLDGVIDSRTSDVCRACFISVDEKAYYNPKAEPVSLEVEIGTEDTSELLIIKRELEREELVPIVREEAVVSVEPDEDQMCRIREMLLKKKVRHKEERNIYVPEELQSMMLDLKVYIENFGIEVYDIIDISYGQKIKSRIGKRTAETNLFYGKNGFTIVITPKIGTNAELNQTLYDVIDSFLADNT